MASGWQFANALVKSPRSVGAIAPSGAALADAMSYEVPKGGGFVVELGASAGRSPGLRAIYLLLLSRVLSAVLNDQKRKATITISNQISLVGQGNYL